jgi:hypothetical protein
MESDPGGATHLLYLPQPEDLQVSARILERFLSSRDKWQFLYFFVLPHQQGSFGARLGFGLRLPVRKSKKRMFVVPHLFGVDDIFFILTKRPYGRKSAIS